MIDSDTLMLDCEERMENVLKSFKNVLNNARTGRANPNIINHIKVNYYGSEMPINQIASISCPEATILMIKPYDKSILRDLEKAIQLSDLHMMPQNDGQVLRLIFPPLTEETKKKLSEHFSNTNWMNNGSEQHQVIKELQQSYLEKGYVYGRIKK